MPWEYFESDVDVEEEVLELMDLMSADENDKTGAVTKARIDAHAQEWVDTISIFVAYPDVFADLLVPKKSSFHFFAIQRIVLRAMARGVNTYIFCSRGFSKSFLADLNRYLHCMFVPRHNTAITAGTNKQAAEIAKQKIVNDLWVKFPFLANEMQKIRKGGKTLDAYKMGTDYVEFNFRNGSSLQIGGVRGLRKESLIFEEIIEQDPIKVNEVLIPMLNRPRAMSNGLINPYEPQSQQIYVTTAGFQQSFAHQKLVEVLCRAAIEPDKYFVIGATYRIPLKNGLTSRKQVEDVINSPTFSKDSFEREYESRWSDAPAGAAFSSSLIATLRQVKKIELKYNLTPTQEENDCFYVVCADMAKDGQADTAVGVAKVIPKEHSFTYKFINLFDISASDYLVVANTLKRTVIAYRAKMLIYDANGIGAAIRDWLNKETKDEMTGEIYRGYGIINPPSEVKKELHVWEPDATICYEIKAGSGNTEHIHWFFFSRMSTGVITFPVRAQEAVQLYGKNKTFLAMSQRKQLSYLQPFKTMDKMELELRNLDIAATSDTLANKVKVVRRNQKIQKDYFSMGEYLVWGVNQYIELQYYKDRARRSDKKRKIAFYN
ncbi:MAG: hypothetical protein KIG63_00290 [Methanobrevibacter sp.]|nr:hypothetical protein [Methanobrevibacter sp.]